MKAVTTSSRPHECREHDLRSYRCDRTSVQTRSASPRQLPTDDDHEINRRLGAFDRLARNATEHAAPGTGVVVKAHPEDAEVVVEVINHGEPIPADLLPFIFEPFRRAQQDKSSTTGNLGLGLYIANQIVGSSGGKLVAYSTDGTTTFLMRLPRQPPAGLRSRSSPPSECDNQAATRPVAAR